MWSWGDRIRGESEYDNEKEDNFDSIGFILFLFVVVGLPMFVWLFTSMWGGP